MEDYKLLKGETPLGLSTQVNTERLIGYKLQGSPFGMMSPSGQWSFYQAVAITIETVPTVHHDHKMEKISVEDFMTPANAQPNKVKKKSLADDYASVGGTPKKQSGFGLDYEFRSGKYQGSSVHDVISENAGYMDWLINNTGFELNNEAFEFLKDCL